MNAMELIEREVEQMALDGTLARGEPGDNVKAAMCYIRVAQRQLDGMAVDVTLPKSWPWPEAEWIPDEHIVKNNLKRAAALLIAEWDRVDATGL